LIAKRIGISKLLCEAQSRLPKKFSATIRLLRGSLRNFYYTENRREISGQTISPVSLLRYVPTALIITILVNELKNIYLSMALIFLPENTGASVFTTAL
jgi:hypothetical protein